MKNTDYIGIEKLTGEQLARARKMAEDELRLEGAEVTTAMIVTRTEEYLYHDTAEAFLRELRPEFAKREQSAPARPPKVAVPAEAVSAVPANGTGEAEVERVIRVKLVDLDPSPLNPRTNFPAEQLEEMAESILSRGVIQPLIVRSVKRGRWEIVAGHRRYRAAEIAKVADVPVIARALDDGDVVEVMLIENLQRADLSPIEEARGIEMMLSLKGADGSTPRHTVESIAKKIGRTEKSVANTRRILRVPEKFHAKIADGSLPRTICYLIAAIPDAKLREKAAAEIVKGDYNGPFTKRGAQEHIRRNYMVELRGSPFDQKDATLVPVKEEAGERCAGGACDSCPLNSANRQDDDIERGHITMCMNPACYQLKVDAHVRGAMRAAESAGDKLVTGKAAAKLLGWEGDVLSGTGLVKLNEKPTGELVGAKKAPNWEKMLGGEVKAQVTTVIDAKGRVFRLVDRKQAIEAAKVNGFKDLFVAGAEKKASPREQDDVKMKERQAKEREQGKLDTATAAAWVQSLVEHIATKGLNAKSWLLLLSLAIGHAGSDGRKWTINRRGLESVKVKDKWRGEISNDEKTLETHARTLDEAGIIAFVVELMLSQGMRWHGVKDESLIALCTACGIDLAAIEARVKAQMAEKKKPKNAAAQESQGNKGGKLKPGKTSVESIKEEKALDVLSRQLETMRKSMKMEVSDVLAVAHQVLGRGVKTHGGANNFWLKEDYELTIAELVKRAAKDGLAKRPAAKLLTAAEKSAQLAFVDDVRKAKVKLVSPSAKKKAAGSEVEI